MTHFTYSNIFIRPNLDSIIDRRKFQGLRSVEQRIKKGKLGCRNLGGEKYVCTLTILFCDNFKYLYHYLYFVFLSCSYSFVNNGTHNCWMIKSILPWECKSKIGNEIKFREKLPEKQELQCFFQRKSAGKTGNEMFFFLWESAGKALE